ncbi:MAG: TraB/GumN family protein [Gammaproteobacteria bacterium]|nr:MAG: TraB/GumN family protein [Gammaproteobacteria bacterium]
MKQSNQRSCYLVWHLAVALAFAAAVFNVQAGDRFDKGLLWKIEPDGGTPSYLFGTMHSDDPRVVQLPAPVRQVFDKAGSVTLEVELDAQSLTGLTTALLLTDGKKLESLIGPGLYKRTVQAMNGLGMPEAVVTNMKPWAAAVTLMTPPNVSGVVLDQLLYQQALLAGKKVSGLETVAEQMALFDELPLKDQIALLRDTLDQLPEFAQMLEDLQTAYLDRDLKRLVEINETSMQGSNAQLADRLNQTVIIDRNHRMAERMKSRLQEGDHFIAVGALHLPGKEGLLTLLSEQGYRVTRIY